MQPIQETNGLAPRSSLKTIIKIVVVVIVIGALIMAMIKWPIIFFAAIALGVILFIKWLEKIRSKVNWI